MSVARGSEVNEGKDGERTSAMFMMEPTAMLDHEKPFCCGAILVDIRCGKGPVEGAKEGGKRWWECEGRKELEEESGSARPRGGLRRDDRALAHFPQHQASQASSAGETQTRQHGRSRGLGESVPFFRPPQRVSLLACARADAASECVACSASFRVLSRFAPSLGPHRDSTPASNRPTAPRFEHSRPTVQHCWLAANLGRIAWIPIVSLSSDAALPPPPPKVATPPLPSNSAARKVCQAQDSRCFAKIVISQKSHQRAYLHLDTLHAEIVTGRHSGAE